MDILLIETSLFCFLNLALWLILTIILASFRVLFTSTVNRSLTFKDVTLSLSVILNPLFSVQAAPNSLIYIKSSPRKNFHHCTLFYGAKIISPLDLKLLARRGSCLLVENHWPNQLPAPNFREYLSLCLMI